MSFSVDLTRSRALSANSGWYPDGSRPIVEIVVFYGQSNTFGVRTAESTAIDDAVNSDGTKIRMLNATFDGLVAASELINTRADASWEALDSSDTSGAISYANYYRDHKAKQGNPNVDMVVMLNGAPSSTAAQLSQGTSPYTDWDTDIAAIVGLIQAEGKTPVVNHIIYGQGERDISEDSEAGWDARVVNDIYTPMVTRIKALTGQTNDPTMQINVISAMYTTSTNTLAFEMYDAGLLNSNVKVTAYSGYAEHYTDTLHYSGLGQRYMCQQNAKFAVYDTLEALKVSSVVLVGSTLELTVTGGYGDLQVVMPVGMSSVPTDHNFRAFEGGTNAVSITNVTLDNVNRKIILTLADGGVGSNYTVDGSYYTTNALGSNTGGQYNTGRVPITDTDTRKGELSDSATHGNPDLFNPLMPFRFTGIN